MEISDLLERAKARLQISSDRQLAHAVGIVHSSFLSYRRGHMLPSDDAMLRICLAAGVSAEHGLVLLNIWRSGDHSRTIYRRIAKILSEAGLELYNKKDARTAAEQINIK